jgi:hypothetical protein
MGVERVFREQTEKSAPVIINDCAAVRRTGKVSLRQCYLHLAALAAFVVYGQHFRLMPLF